MRTTSSRDSWERLVAAVIKREQIRQLCHQDSITTVDSDFSQRDLSLRSVPSFPSRPPLTKDSAVEVRKNGSRTITKKLFSALLWRKKHKDYDLGKGLVGIPEDHFGLKRFSLLKLQVATDNFNNQNFLGRGGLGNVYKGRLADGSLVAVIQISITSLRQIEEELEILSIVKHCNVIGLLGLCITENERLIVYPYMANGSVDSCLRGRRESQPPLGWETRLRIALGVARGLDYLHHGCIRGIIHRDVKAANILLDEDFEAVVSDLSLAIFTDSIDHVMRGTIGHIAPEYLSTGKCSWKTDVYGYGMFLLELITAQHGINPGRLGGGGYVTLLDWVKKLLEEKKCEIIVDPYLEGNYVDEEVEKLFQIALICTKTDPEGRPTMSEIVRMLEYGDGLGEAWEEVSKNYSTDLGEELVGIPEDHFGLKRFSLRELQVATDNFNNQKFLGRGGFGKGYKGRLADGSLVAVKDLAEVTIHEALEILSVVKHRNVICPLGGCFTEKNRLIVYPYMANGSVASCLRERRESQPPLEWETRLRIALGVARGLDYLHHGGIIHRDVKAANILLDEDFEAVVSDFSLSIFMDNIDNGVRGTVFHIAPEYLSTGKCSLETDVYGYGIFLLELITAQRAFGLARLANDVDVMLLDWVKNLFEEKKFEIIVDRDLEGNFVEEEVEKLFQIVLICTQTDPEGRPTMSEIVRLLEYGDGLDDGREKFFQNVYQDENYSSKLHPSGFSSNAEEVSGPR